MEEGSLFQKIRQIFQAEDEMDEGMKKQAAALIRNIFRYMDKDAKDIMTHRKNIIAIDGEEKLEDALKFMLDENFSRFPIYKEDIDEIIGFLHLRDAMACYLAKEQRHIPVSELGDYIRAVSFIPETKSIDTLFREMQVSHNHVVIVLDEYGQTSGLVTMEDILEELVGNIFDEHDVEERMITCLPTGNYLVNGFTDLEDLEDHLEIRFEKDNYGTLNGFLIDQLERIPSQEERCVVEYEGYRFTVLLVDNNTIRRVKIEKMTE